MSLGSYVTCIFTTSFYMSLCYIPHIWPLIKPLQWFALNFMWMFLWSTSTQIVTLVCHTYNEIIGNCCILAIFLKIFILFFLMTLNIHTELAWRSSSVMTATRRTGIRFPVGTVYLPNFTFFARDSKWGYHL